MNRRAGFTTILGPDYAGKTTLLQALAERGWTVAAGDDPAYPELAAIRRRWLTDVLPHVGTRYCAQAAAVAIHPVVQHMREQVEQAPADRPVVVDSYYFKLRAKLRLMGILAERQFASWADLVQPDRVVMLDADPADLWPRTLDGLALNPFEHYGRRPTRTGFLLLQSDLRHRLHADVRHLPVTVVDATAGLDAGLAAVQSAGRELVHR